MVVMAPMRAPKPAGGPEKFTSAATHVVVAGALGVIGALIMGFTGGWGFSALVGWDVMAAVFVAWIWLTIWPRDARSTASHAVREDPGRPVVDLRLVGASVAGSILSCPMMCITESPSANRWSAMMGRWQRHRLGKTVDGRGTSRSPWMSNLRA
mgnify:CR=1 FL=1